MTDLLKRLRSYNPPDRTVDGQRQIAVDIHDAADEIDRLTKLRKEDARLYIKAISSLCDSRSEIERLTELLTEAVEACETSNEFPRGWYYRAKAVCNELD